MTIQEKIEILEGVSNHPNKEKLVFKIDGDWVSYQDLENNVGEVKQKYGIVYIEQGHDLDIDVEVYKRLKNMEFISIDIKDIEDELNGDIEKAIVESFNKNK